MSSKLNKLNRSFLSLFLFHVPDGHDDLNSIISSKA